MKFLVKEWDNDFYVVLCKGYQVYVGLDEECYVLQGVNNNTVMKKSVPEQDCQHWEADTIVWHLSHINRTGDSTNVPVQCIDTDVLVILLYHIHRYISKVWMDVGLSSGLLELAAKFCMNLNYVCGLYNMPVISSINKARFQ